VSRAVPTGPTWPTGPNAGGVSAWARVRSVLQPHSEVKAPRFEWTVYRAPGQAEAHPVADQFQKSRITNGRNTCLCSTRKALKTESPPKTESPSASWYHTPITWSG
jgi:hypothetical protein